MIYIKVKVRIRKNNLSYGLSFELFYEPLETLQNYENRKNKNQVGNKIEIARNFKLMQRCILKRKKNP